MKLLKIKREPTQIVYTIIKEGRDGKEDKIKVETKDLPLPAFSESLKMMGAVCAKLLELGEDWGKEIICKGIDEISYSASGVRSVKIAFMRNFSHFNAAVEIKIPMFPIDDLDSSEENSKKYPNINDEDINIIIAFIDAAIDYTSGNRAQGQLALDDNPYTPKPNTVKEGDDLDFEKTAAEAYFHKIVDSCKSNKQLVDLVKSTFKEDWAGNDMKLPDLKLKAKNHYSQNRSKFESV